VLDSINYSHTLFFILAKGQKSLKIYQKKICEEQRKYNPSTMS
jgi:hypothetical protein